MIVYKLVLAISLLLLFLILYHASWPYQLCEKSTRKKLSAATFFAVIYLALYFLPAFLSIRFFGIILFVELLISLVSVVVSFLTRESRIIRKLIEILVGGVTMVFLVVTPIAVPWFYTMLVGNEELHATVEEIVSGKVSEESKVRAILDWEEQNMINMYEESNLIFDFPPIWWRASDPSWIYFYRRGNCGEYATLFMKMAGFANIKSRTVHDYGEDHAWAEVWVDNRWIHVDPSKWSQESSDKYYDNPKVYEENWEKQISYVFAVYENGDWANVTDTYTDTGMLIVHVTKNRRDVENAIITVKSKHLMEKGLRSSPKNIVSNSRFLENNRTSENGTSVFYLGGNNYKVIAISDSGEKRGENTVHINEHSVNQVNITLSEEVSG